MSRAPAFIDARPLQDPNYQFRGVGFHISSLIRSRTEAARERFRLVGLVDESLGEMPSQYVGLFDEISRSHNFPFPRSGSVFVHSSPMTHDTRLTMRFVSHPNLLTAGVVYDFIPLDWPGYLPDVPARIIYLSQLARLKKCDLFMPISRYTAARLRELLGIPRERIEVTGASVRSSLVDCAFRRRESADWVLSSPPYFLTVGGGDPNRKNTEVVIRAVHRLRQLTTLGVRLKIVGHYGLEYARNLMHIATELGDSSFIDFYRGVEDAALVDLYAGSIATVVPSHIEGFSLPVVEAALCQSPVVVSTCAAHLELVEQPAALFPSTSDTELCDRLAALLNKSNLRSSLQKQQETIWQRFVEKQVSSRFWNFLVREWDRRFVSEAPHIYKRRKPRVAFLSPFPPDESGCARFTELTIRAAESCFEIDLYSNARRPLSSYNGFRDGGLISAAPLACGGYNAILSVIGNSHFHNEVFDFMERYGGPCVLHDSRLTQIYYHRLGHDGFLRFATKWLGRSVNAEEVAEWLQDRNLPSYFIEPILESATPLIVHTRAYQQILRNRYDCTAHVATFPPNIDFTREEILPSAREAARRRLGLPEGFIVSTFGYVQQTKGAFQCIAALDLLRSWGIPAELYFVGHSLIPKEAMDAVARDFGVTGHMHLSGGFVEITRYRDFMIASDAAISLRTYGYGQPSAAMVDTISAGMPAVASAELAETCEAPSYIKRVPDIPSPLFIAEGLAAICEERTSRERFWPERERYCQSHSFAEYARRLSEILGFG